MMHRGFVFTAITAGLSSLALAAFSGTAYGQVSGGADPARPTPYFVRYFDQSTPLFLEPGALALRPVALDAEAFNGWTPALAAKLAQHAVVEDTGEMTSVGGFVRARIEQPGDGIAAQELATRNTVADIAEDPAFSFASPVFLDERGLPYIVTDEIIVGLEPGADRDEALAGFAADGLDILEHDLAGMNGVFLLRSSSRDGFEVLAQANDIAARPGVRFSEPNAVIRGESFINPNDPLFSQQWALQQGSDFDMDGPEAWDIATGDDSVITVILDVGMQFNHPDLNNAPGQDFSGSVPNGGPANNCDNHGTAVAGCVSAILNNSTGIVGGAPGSRTASGKIGVSTSFFGLCFGFFDSQPTMLVSALNWSASSGARVTNSSFGYGVSAAVTTAYDTTRSAGVLHFAASGNGGTSSVSYPANLSSVNAIGALQQNGTLASFSQFGVGQQFVAPGAAILSTDRTGSAGYQNGDYTTIDGTSFASPYAASVAALIISINPDLNVAEVEQIMRDSAVDMGPSGYDTTFGWGRVNLHAAALAAQDTIVEPGCPGDLDDSGGVNSNDLGILLSAFGSSDAGDLDGDGDTDSDDLGLLLGSFGCTA
ncbi:MAG: S8 family serine peptidase [Phycisphaerales bacterium]